MTAESESSIDIDDLKTGNHTKESDSPKNTRKRTERRERSISREDKSESGVDADLVAFERKAVATASRLTFPFLSTNP